MKITLIGASGFIGTRLIELFKQIPDFDLLNIDKRQSHFYPEITTIANVLDKDKLISLLKETEVVILLAAEHKDDVSPTSLYYDVNVQGAKNVLDAMNKNNVKNIIFMSSVAVYGLNKDNPCEEHNLDPFNHYGKSKWQAENALKEWWQENPLNRSVTVIRSTVIFGERNRGNVYNLLKQISSGKFLMVGKGFNYKSMAYIGNVVSFIKFQVNNIKPGHQIFNYVDKPDYNMNMLISQVEKSLNKKIPSNHLPYWLGMCGGFCFDLLALITGRKFSISSVRVKKFCATTQYDAMKAHNCGFKASYTLEEGLHKTLQYEFLNEAKDNVTFISE
jgi:Nucleoside-diphosphate-sugar epimerases